MNFMRAATPEDRKRWQSDEDDRHAARLAQISDEHTRSLHIEAVEHQLRTEAIRGTQLVEERDPGEP